MAHIHNVVDTDAHYKINGATRKITNVDETKRTLVQHDHNSERLTFEIQRRIDGHDFTSCNIVQIHFKNEDAFGRNKSTGVYPVGDLHVKSDDNEVVMLSWLVSEEATKFAGSLSFSIRFACVEEGVTEYAWHTIEYNEITILACVYIFDSSIVTEYQAAEGVSV